MKTRYNIIKKEELRRTETIQELNIYLAEDEFTDLHLVHVTKGLKTKRYIGGRIDDTTANRYDLAIALVNYDIKFYRLLEDYLITNKLNNLVSKKGNIELRKTAFDSIIEEDEAYAKEEERAYKELVNVCRK